MALASSSETCLYSLMDVVDMLETSLSSLKLNLNLGDPKNMAYLMSSGRSSPLTSMP